MFDIGWGEMLVIAIVLLLVVGPKELPGMLRSFGKTTAKLRVMANDFRKQFDEALKEADLDDLKTLNKDVRKLNPVNEIRKALSPMEEAARDVRSGLDKAMNPTGSSAAGSQAAKPATPAAAAAPEAVAKAEPATTTPAEKPATAKPVARAKPAARKPAAAKTPAKSAAKPKPAAKPKAAAVKPAAKPDSAARPAAAKPGAASKPKAGGAAS